MRFTMVNQQLHTLKAEIPSLGRSPIIIDFHEQRTNQADDRGLIGENPPLCVDALLNLIRDGRVKNLYDMEECFIYCDLKWSRLQPSFRESTAQFSPFI